MARLVFHLIYVSHKVIEKVSITV